MLKKIKLHRPSFESGIFRALLSKARIWNALNLKLAARAGGKRHQRYTSIEKEKKSVRFADSYLPANIEFRNEACSLGKY